MINTLFPAPKAQPMTLRPYQDDAVEAVYQYLRDHDDNPCVVLPTAAGKSLILGQIAADAVTKWNGRVLILAHVKELLQQNAEKIQALCPSLDIGVYSAGLNSRDTDHSVIVAGIQSVYKKACDLDAFDLIITDECFPAGTMVSTPRGDTPIEDLYVGQPVHTALGVGKVEAISAKPTYTLFELEFENGKTIQCTHNHPFLTERGWQKAKALEVGSCLFSRQDMQDLRNRHEASNLLSPRWSSKKLRRRDQVERQDVLLQAVHGVSGATRCVAIRKDLSDEEDMLMLRQNLPPMDQAGCHGQGNQLSARETMETAAFLLDLLFEESGERHVDPRRSGAGQSNTEGHWACTDQSRRERATDRTADSDASMAGRGMVSRMGYPNGIPSSRRDAETSQDRYCQSGEKDCYRAGRGLPSHIQETQGRQAESGIFASQRVVRITPIQCQSPVPVFNLQVAGHPSYYADGVLSHNCHLIPENGEGMYRTFLADAKVINPNVRLIGLTATPYRMSTGMICGPDNLLNHVCYEIGVKELIVQGYLCPLKSRAGKIKANLDNLHIRAGEFIASEIEAAMDNVVLVQTACEEVVELTQNRSSVLIFTSGVKHGQHVASSIERISGQKCGFVCGDTPGLERESILNRFKAGELKYLANVNVLTTGFDAPNIDSVVLLRPTNSPGLFYQCCGRGFRLHPSKTDTLVLDYGGNILRHGPVDDLQIKTPGQSGGDAPAKECPQCFALIHAAYANCPECDYEFPPPEKEKHEAKASNAGILSGQVTDAQYDVTDASYYVHTKRGADEDTPKTMRIDYQIGWNNWQSEWVCPEHTGYARGKFEAWWRKRSNEPFPDSAEAAVELAESGCLAETTSITVRSVSGEKFDSIISCTIGEIPPRSDGSDERDGGDLPVHDWIDDADVPF